MNDEKIEVVNNTVGIEKQAVETSSRKLCTFTRKLNTNQKITPEELFKTTVQTQSNLDDKVTVQENKEE